MVVAAVLEVRHPKVAVELEGPSSRRRLQMFRFMRPIYMALGHYPTTLMRPQVPSSSWIPYSVPLAQNPFLQMWPIAPYAQKASTQTLAIQTAPSAPKAPTRTLALQTAPSAPKAPTPILALPTARSVQLAPSPPRLAPHRASNALAATTVLLAPLRGLASIAAEATTALTALALQPPALTKCLQLADGAIYKSKALHSLWKQPTASTTASGTLRQATACSANARPIPELLRFFSPSRPQNRTRTSRALAALSPRSSAMPPLGFSHKKASMRRTMGGVYRANIF